MHFPFASIRNVVRAGCQSEIDQLSKETRSDLVSFMGLEPFLLNLSLELGCALGNLGKFFQFSSAIFNERLIHQPFHSSSYSYFCFRHPAGLDATH